MITSSRARHLALLSSLLCLASGTAACEQAGASTAPEGQEGLPAPIFADRVEDGCGTDKEVGQQFEDFELPGLGGDTVRMSDFKGRVVLLNFWGTWCKPCLEELPEFSALYRAYREHGLSLVAVSTDDDAQTVSEVAKHHQLTAHFALAGEALAEQRGEHDFPFTYLLGPDGKIEAAWDGYDAKCLGHIEERVRGLLSDPGSVAGAQTP